MQRMNNSYICVFRPAIMKASMSDDFPLTVRHTVLLAQGHRDGWWHTRSNCSMHCFISPTPLGPLLWHVVFTPLACSAAAILCNSFLLIMNAKMSDDFPLIVWHGNMDGWHYVAILAYTQHPTPTRVLVLASNSLPWSTENACNIFLFTMNANAWWLSIDCMAWLTWMVDIIWSNSGIYTISYPY